MSTLRTNTLQTTDSSFSINVADLITQASAVKPSDLANNTNPLLGAGLVGYKGSTVYDRLSKVVLSTDYPSLSAAIAANLNVKIPAGVHTVTSPIPLSSGQTIELEAGAIVRNTTTGDTGIFSIAAGVSNVSIYGPGELQGPYTSTTPVPAPVYPGGNGAIRITGDYNNRCTDIRVEGVKINGWGDYGIFAENVTNGAFNSNRIQRCGRDGIRFYGALYTVACLNRIRDIFPGFGGVAPNLNVYGITFTRRPTAGTDLTLNPPSRYCIAASNVITNCQTWKGLDTHGGQDLLFCNNIIGNCHIGIGIDEGDTVGATDAPPIRIKVIGNNITRGSGNSGGAGINLSSSNATNMGEDNELSHNVIRGHGGVSTGGINIAYQLRPLVSSNQLVDSLIAGINIPGGVKVTGFRFNDNVIKNVIVDGATPAIAAITIQTGEADGCIDGLTLVRESGTMFGFSLPTLTAGYLINIGGEITQTGSITLFTSGSVSRVSGGGWLLAPRAFARVTSAGALSHQTGVSSVTYVGTGVYDVVLSYTGTSTQTLHPYPTRRSTTAGMINAVPTSTNTIRVTTFNSAGAAADTEFDLLVHGI